MKICIWEENLKNGVQKCTIEERCLGKLCCLNCNRTLCFCRADLCICILDKRLFQLGLYPASGKMIMSALHTEITYMLSAKVLQQSETKQIKIVISDVNFRDVMAELFGKQTGICRGQGGSMHMFSAEHNFVKLQMVITKLTWSVT